MGVLGGRCPCGSHDHSADLTEHAHRLACSLPSRKARTDVHLGVIDRAALQSLAEAIPLLSERLGSLVRTSSA